MSEMNNYVDARWLYQQLIDTAMDNSIMADEAFADGNGYETYFRAGCARTCLTAAWTIARHFNIMPRRAE